MVLTDLQSMKCKTCGEQLDLSRAQGGVIKCALCESTFTLPKQTTEPKVLDFLSRGEHELDTGRFEDAYAAFSKAVELDKTEPEAYWGLLSPSSKFSILRMK